MSQQQQIPRGARDDISKTQITLGILAGGRASRLGGRDKAWLTLDGMPQVVRIAQRFAVECGTLLVSANAQPERYALHGFDVVPDRVLDIGPLGGIDALATACITPWLLTIPVDIVDANGCLLRTFAHAGAAGAVAEDDDGLQPLVALYRTDALRAATAAAIAACDFSVQAMQARLQLPQVRFAGLRVGNLNTPDDLRAAGIDHD